jgi:D-glycero-alpha-D-manno-heptose 1-phosphate guanylyltransferase
MGTSDGTVAVVLAGGFGTRIRHLHPDLPKPMIPVAGEPFLHWVCRWLAREGIRRAVVSTGHLAEVVDAWLARGPVPGLRLSSAREEEPLGTAGGFLHSVARLEGEAWDAVVVANGDSLVVADLAPALARAREPGVDAVILGIEVEDASRYGTLEVSPLLRLRAFREKRPGAAIVNAGVYVFPRRTVEGLSRARSPSFEKDVFPDLLTRGSRIDVVPVRAPFLDIGVPESLAQADSFIRSVAL